MLVHKSEKHSFLVTNRQGSKKATIEDIKYSRGIFLSNILVIATSIGIEGRDTSISIGYSRRIRVFSL